MGRGGKGGARPDPSVRPRGVGVAESDQWLERDGEFGFYAERVRSCAKRRIWRYGT